MKRFLAILICFVLLSAAFAVSVSFFLSSTATALDEKTKLEQELAELQKKQAANKAEYNSIMKEKGATDKKLQSINSQIETTKSEISTLNSLVSKLNNDLKVKTDELNALNAELEESFEVYKQRIRADYEEGQTTYLDVLFGSKSLSDFMTRLDVISQINEYNNGLIEDMKTKLTELNNVKKSIEDNKAETVNAKSQLNEQKNQLNSQYNENEKLAKDLQNDAVALQRLMEAEQRESEKLQEKINKLMSTGTEYSGGIMAWPLPGFGTITSPFGSRINPITKKQSTHYGVDISTGGKTGRTVVAANDGKVVLVTYDYYGGNMIMIDHGGGIATKYLHLSSFNVSVGQTVTRGQTIALSGNTGAWTTGPHLHFEVVVNGTRVNPLNYIKYK